MLTPRNDRVSLPDDIYELLVYYYNDAYYDLEFVIIAGASDKLILEEESEDFIVVLPNITQHGRIAPDIERIHKYWQSLYKIMKRSIRFQVKFYFTHTIDLPTGSKMHQLTFVK